MEGDMLFEAIEEDYKILKDVWMNIIKSWLDINQIKNININNRIFYLPEDSQYIYWKIYNEKNIISVKKCKELAFTGNIKDLEYDEAMINLKEMGLIIENNGAIRTHLMEEPEDENQSKMFTGG